MRMLLSKHLKLCIIGMPCMLQNLLPRVILPKDWGSQGICTPTPISHYLGATLSSPVGRILFTSTSRCGWAGKESSCNAVDLDLIPVLGRSPGEGKGYPLQNSGLENSMDCIAHGITESDTTEWLTIPHHHSSSQNSQTRTHRCEEF